MPCPFCAADNPPTHRYCESCGVALQLPTHCQNYGSEIQASHRFCGKCGFILSAVVATPTPREIPVVPISARLRRLWDVVDSRLDRAQSVLRLTDDDDMRIPLKLEVGIVAALTLIALFLRVWNLEGLPYGMHGDEAEFIEEVQRILMGEWIGTWTGLAGGNGAGHLYFAVPFFIIGGHSLEMLRLSVAIIGAALIPIALLLVRQLFGVRIALITTGLMTFSLWFIIQSRIGWQLVHSTFMFIAGMWLLFAGYKSRKGWVSAAGGPVFGLGIYTSKIYLIYFPASWAVILVLTLLHPRLRRRNEPYLFLSASLLVAAQMLYFYLTDFQFSASLQTYGESGDLTESLVGRFRSVWDAVTLVHNPVQGNTLEAPPAIPILHPVAQVFFWAGLVVAALSINKFRFQALLLGWMISILPLIVFEGGESRRYLLGIFFVLVFVVIGLDAYLMLLNHALRQWRAKLNLSDAKPRRLVYGVIAAIAIVLLVCLSAFRDLRALDEWGKIDALAWFFNHDATMAFEFMDTLDHENYYFRYYSTRFAFDSSVRRVVAPDAVGKDEAIRFGGSGGILPDDEVRRNTVFVFLDKYLPLAEQMQAVYPRASKMAERIEKGKPVYVAYFVPLPPD